MKATDLRADILRAARLFLMPDDVVEVRVLGVDKRRYGVFAGYFDAEHVDALVDAVIAADTIDGANTYLTINPVNPDLLARAANRLAPHARHTTADADIIRRRWGLIDLDPVRASGIAATDGEHEAALARTDDVAGFLAAHGVPADALVQVDTGNGAAVYISTDLPNDAASLRLVQRVLAALALRFSDDVVTVDTTVANAARIVRVPGTLNRKGDSTPERPHRLSRLLHIPQTIAVCAMDALAGIAALAPQEEPRREHAFPNSGRAFDLDTFMARHLQGAIGPHAWSGGRKWVLPVCPWDTEHMNRAAFIVQFASGAVAAGCHHHGCEGKGWSDLRQLMEPGYRERRDGGTDRTHTAIEHPTDDGAPPSLRWRTARVIAATSPAAVPWIATLWLARGAITELAGKIKTAGKTTFLLAMVRAIVSGAPFLGRPTVKSRVVLLTEQPDTSLTEALRRADLLDCNDLVVLTHADARNLAWGKVVEAAVAKAKEIGAGVLAVDTLGPWARFAGDAENNAGDGQDAIAPLQVAAANGLAVLVVRHEKKGDAEIGEAARGSSAISGAVDVIMSLRRCKAPRPTIRRLLALSRFSDTPPELLVELADSGDYVVIDPEEAQKLKRDDDRRKILGALPPDVDAALPANEIGKKAGVGEKAAAALLKVLIDKQLTRRLGTGVKGDPFRFFATAPEPPDEGGARFSDSSHPYGEHACRESNRETNAQDRVASMAPSRGENPSDSMLGNGSPYRGAMNPEPWPNGHDADVEVVK